MGLTPLQGLVMGTRSGDVDPGLHTFLHNELGLSVGDIDTLLNKQSGLKGMAGVNDFRELEQRRSAGDDIGPARLRRVRASAQALRRRLPGHPGPAGRAQLHRRGGREQSRLAGRRGRGSGRAGSGRGRRAEHGAIPGRPGSSPPTARRSRSRWSRPTRNWPSPARPPPCSAPRPTDSHRVKQGDDPLEPPQGVTRHRSGAALRLNPMATALITGGTSGLGERVRPPTRRPRRRPGAGGPRRRSPGRGAPRSSRSATASRWRRSAPISPYRRRPAGGRPAGERGATDRPLGQQRGLRHPGQAHRGGHLRPHEHGDRRDDPRRADPGRRPPGER